MYDKLIHTPGAEYVILGALFLSLIVFGIWAVTAARNYFYSRGPKPIDLLSDFRTARERGDLDEQEYRRVKKLIGDKELMIL